MFVYQRVSKIEPSIWETQICQKKMELTELLWANLISSELIEPWILGEMLREYVYHGKIHETSYHMFRQTQLLVHLGKLRMAKQTQIGIYPPVI